MSTATVVPNERGDFEVQVDGKCVKGGYFSRMEDYANTEANKMARNLNLEAGN